MKNLFILFLLITTLCLWAQNVPQTIDYQGRLADSDGNYLNSVITVDFLIFSVETGGTLLWNETQDVSCANGIFHVQLGSVAAFPSTLFDGSDRWLELEVGGETLSPRTIVASVPYAIKAETAYNVEVPLNLSGNVSDPNSVITGENTGTGYGVLGIHNESSNIGYLGNSVSGVYGYCIEPTTKGVYGLHSNGNYGYLGSSDYGVYGHNYSSSGAGVYGYNTSVNGYGVYGNSTGKYGGYFNASYNSSLTHVIHAEYTGTGNMHATGVYVICKPTDWYGYGGQFEGGRIGIIGRVSPIGNEHYWGVYGVANGGSGINYAVYGYSYDGGTTYAGYFNGNVHVTGTFTNPSDERFKENVQPFKNALSKIKLMDVHTFNFIQMAEEKQLVLPEGKQIGLIAQELEEILPELVVDNVHAYDKSEGIEGAESDIERIEYKGINYIGLIPVLIEAIKELQMQNEEHQQKLQAQQKQIDELLRADRKK
ncbi:MAG: tail fiber domain-containing protein [Candidatus Tenebribacter davisii]|nr:tail fiber domain-containing protein [Candidatus Tenebribacter davisii]